MNEFDNWALVRTLITLPKHLRKIESPLDSLIPPFRFESEFGLGVTSCDGRKLEEVARDDYLYSSKHANRK